MNRRVSKVLDSSKYQVIMMSCPAVPFIFARHHWFVINQTGKVSRYESSYVKNVDLKTDTYVCKNYFKDPGTFGIIPYNRHGFLEGKIEHTLEGAEAKEMINFIIRTPEEYPLRNCYKIMGPNSNTYIQWVLDSYPSFDWKLPWNAIGKNYKINIVRG